MDRLVVTDKPSDFHGIIVAMMDDEMMGLGLTMTLDFDWLGIIDSNFYIVVTIIFDLLGSCISLLLEILPSYDLLSKLSNMPNLNKSDLDENFIHTINSKYHSVSDLN